MNATSDIVEFRDKVRAHFAQLADHYQIVSLAFFASRVRGEGRPDSDLDVLARFEVTPTLFKIIALENELSDLLGVHVDLVLHGSLKPSVEARVVAEQVLI